MTNYVVISPEHTTHYGSELEPPEEGVDVALIVNAPNATKAKWAATRLWERHYGRLSWPATARGDGLHPLTGVTVERVADDDEEQLDPSGWQPCYADLADE